MNAYDVIIMPWLTEKTMEARTHRTVSSSLYAELHEEANRSCG